MDGWLGAVTPGGSHQQWDHHTAQPPAASAAAPPPGGPVAGDDGADQLLDQLEALCPLLSLDSGQLLELEQSLAEASTEAAGFAQYTQAAASSQLEAHSFTCSSAMQQSAAAPLGEWQQLLEDDGADGAALDFPHEYQQECQLTLQHYQYAQGYQQQTQHMAAAPLAPHCQELQQQAAYHQGQPHAPMDWQQQADTVSNFSDPAATWAGVQAAPQPSSPFDSSCCSSMGHAAVALGGCADGAAQPLWEHYASPEPQHYPGNLAAATPNGGRSPDAGEALPGGAWPCDEAAQWAGDEAARQDLLAAGARSMAEQLVGLAHRQPDVLLGCLGPVFAPAQAGLYGGFGAGAPALYHPQPTVPGYAVIQELPPSAGRKTLRRRGLKRARYSDTRAGGLAPAVPTQVTSALLQLMATALQARQQRQQQQQ